MGIVVWYVYIHTGNHQPTIHEFHDLQIDIAGSAKTIVMSRCFATT